MGKRARAAATCVVGGVHKGCKNCQNVFLLEEFGRHRCNVKKNKGRTQRQGNLDKQEFLWRHCQGTKDLEIVLLPKGDTVLESSTTSRKVVK